MKILFLYKVADHARPLRVVMTQLRERGIDIEDYNTRSHSDCRGHLHRKADLLLVYSQLMESAINYEHGPILGRVLELYENFSVYDATYVALAEALGASLLTADRRLARAGIG